ncbi:MAG: recombinase family protein [Selenomonadaceae bacterium]|nr:recombinase family protein [Selenomonadaceae bacterium]
MSEKVYAYGRVSTKEQHVDRQVIAFRKVGVKPENFFLDKISGKDFERPAYKAMIRKLKEGDTLVIKSIDRLGRSYEDTINQWRYITKEKKVSIQVIDTPILNTAPDRDLMGTVICDVFLQLQSAFAQQEREIIHSRQAEGIEAAKQRGVKFGRPPKKIPDGFATIKKNWEEGSLTASRAGFLLGVSHNTFLKWVRNCRN